VERAPRCNSSPYRTSRI